MKEIWKDIEGYEGLYQISSNGKFRNLKRNVVLKGSVSHNYIYYTFGKKGGRVGTHILVAKAFPEICGEWFEGAVVHHKDYNRQNNNAKNLMILTKSQHSALHYKTQPSSFTEPSEKRSKSISNSLSGRKAVEKYKPVECFTKEGVFVKRYNSITETKQDGYSIGNVCSACKGKLKAAYGLVWRYAA